MTGATAPAIFLQPRWMAVCLLAAHLCWPSDFLQSAETITAYVDAQGRVIFVNESHEPRAPAPPLPPGNASAPSGRKVVASTNGALANGAPLSSASNGSLPDSSNAAAIPLPEHIDTLIEQAASHHQVDPDLVRAIIQVESNFNPYAVSPKGAQGLMQLIPATARRFGVANPFDPRANIDGGIRYLKYLLGMFDGDLRLTLAAYNAGENNVARRRDVPPIRETQNYVRKIAELYPLRVLPGGLPPAPQIVRFVDSSGVIHFSNTGMP